MRYKKRPKYVEMTKYVQELFLTLRDNTTSNIALITGYDKIFIQNRINEFEFVKKKLYITSNTIEEPVDNYNLTEEQLINRSSDSDIIEKYNTPCYSKTDFKTRLLIAKMI